MNRIVIPMLVLALSGCTSNSKQPQEADDQTVAVKDTLAMEKTTEDSTTAESVREQVHNEEVDNDARICQALARFLLDKIGGAVLSESARNDLVESSWPEVQCSVEGTLDVPSSFKDLVVKKVGEGRYRYQCVCPDHGDVYVDCCVMEAHIEPDGRTVIDHVLWE